MPITRSPILTRYRDLTNSRLNLNTPDPIIMDDPLIEPIVDPNLLRNQVLQHQLPPQIGNVGSSTLKLPPFYDKYPQQWFVLVESQFRIKNINQEHIKYDYLLLALSQDLFATVSDIVQNINDNWNHPGLTPYTTLKEALLERNTLSESQRLETLLKDIDIGDRKPSEFYRALKQTAGQSDSITEKLITQLWIRKLPMQIQISLKTLPNPDIKTLLSMADSIYEIFLMNNKGQLQAIGSSSEHHVQNDHISRLEKQITLLTESIQKLTTNTQHTSNETRFRSRSKSRSKRNPSNSTELCWYHNKFGTKAKKCISPCNFIKNE